MIRLILGALIVVVFGFGMAPAQPPAGIVLYFESGGEVYLLLAEHARGQRGWASFGGGAREGETLAETAAHKGEEESRGYFSRADLLEKIKGKAPVMDVEFGFYFAEVDFVPAQRVMNHPLPDSSDAYMERSTFAWIPYSTVAVHVQEDIDRDRTYEIDPAFLPSGSGTNWFWRAWLGNIRKAVLADALPWDE